MIHPPESQQKDSSSRPAHPQAGPESATACLCCYQNHTGGIQVIRIPELPNRHFERVVFPGQRVLFYAPAQARLEVYTGHQAGALLADTLTCDRIQVTPQTR